MAGKSDCRTSLTSGSSLLGSRHEVVLGRLTYYSTARFLRLLRSFAFIEQDSYDVKAEIIAVGSELVTPFRLDTNSLFLTSELNQAGLRVVHKAVVGDAPDEMRYSCEHALARAGVTVSSGGLGPTADNRTHHRLTQNVIQVSAPLDAASQCGGN